MSDDNIIDPPEDGPRPLAFPLPYAADHVVQLIRLALEDLEKRRGRASAKATLGLAIKYLEGGLQTAAEETTRDFSAVLLQALRPGITVSEIQGARAVLELMLAALPTYAEEARS
jgi:hypothetical protein